MDVCAPVPSATIVMTAATPIIMPSIVRAVRILLRPSAFNAIRKITSIDMLTAYHRGRGGRGGSIPIATGFFLLSSVSSVVGLFPLRCTPTPPRPEEVPRARPARSAGGGPLDRRQRDRRGT